MVERVVAIVSRVEGLYEFEVQPLREYFAARHLYNTAPYSPPGGEKHGTKPDRFDALARDFYWLNVVRFYAGCYSIGELASLVNGLESLAHSPGYAHTSHPQMLAATLLSDWVFAQDPLSVKRVTSLIMDGLGLRQITSGGHRRRREELLILPTQNGKEELIDRCFRLLRSGAPTDYSFMLLELIGANASPLDVKDRWFDYTMSYSSDERSQWIRYGLQLGTLSVLSEAELMSLMDDGKQLAARLSLAFRAGHKRFVENDEDRCNAVVEYMLDCRPDATLRRERSILGLFAQALAPYRYTCAFEDRHPIPLVAVRHRGYSISDDDEAGLADLPAPSHTTARKCIEFIELSAAESRRTAVEWATSLRPWESLVESGRRLFGDRWAIYLLANSAAGIRSKEETCEDASELLDTRLPLCRRVRYARLRAGSPGWWQAQLSVPMTDLERRSVLLVAFTWAGPSVLERTLSMMDHNVEQMEDESWLALAEALQHGSYVAVPDRCLLNCRSMTLPAQLSERTVVALASRVDAEGWVHLYEKYLKTYNGDDPTVLELCLRVALFRAQNAPETWREWLPEVRRSYARGASSDRFVGYRFARALNTQRLPTDVAQSIVEDCDNYPIELVGWAEQACRHHVAESVIPVGTIAEEQKWFQ